MRPRVLGWLMAGMLVLGTTAIYWPATQCGFVNYDDDLFVYHNIHVQRGLNWAGVKWAFCNTEQAAYWAPLMWLSHMLAWQCFGMNAWGHHLVNVLLHAASTALVFLVLRRLTGATWRSLVVAALFGSHPLRVESVAWVTERKDVLGMLCWVLALWGYARYVEAAQVRSSRTRLWYGVSLGMFGLGLMSKPVLVVTLPCLLLLLDCWPLQRLPLSAKPFELRTQLPLLPEKLPFFALAAMASVLTVVAQRQAGFLASNSDMPPGARMGNALISYCRYLGKLFWPGDLAVFYPHPGSWPLGEVLLAGMVMLGISMLLVVGRRRYPFLLVGWLWFCGTLVPVIQLVQASNCAMADRFTYVPSLGMLILVIWGVYEAVWPWRYRVQALSVAGGMTIVVCLGLTRQQLHYWQDGIALFRHAVAVTRNNGVAHMNLGYALDEKGRFDEAIRQYQEALRLMPDHAGAHNNLGAALLKSGQIDEAIRQLQEALRLDPDYADACDNLGAALGKKGQTDEAIRQLQTAIRLRPDHAPAHNNLGTALSSKGQVGEAIAQFQEAIRLKPDYSDAHNNLGAVLVGQGRLDEAIGQFEEAIRFKADHADAHYNFGVALTSKGWTNEAIRQYQEALRLKSDNADAHYNLGLAFVGKGLVDEGIRQFWETLRLKPDYAGARQNLEAALAIKADAAPPPSGSNNR